MDLQMLYAYAPHLPLNELPAHRFLKSIHNITIERGWLQLVLRWGRNVKTFWHVGDGIYNPSNPQHFELVQWLWPMLIQCELDMLKECLNSHIVRCDLKKKLPSGTSLDIAYDLFACYGGDQCLQPVDCTVVDALMKDLGGEDLIWFVAPEYAERANHVLAEIGYCVEDLSFHNIWNVFSMMLPLM